jgi:imidazole glycerol-phosphate synthase subunit HisH
VTVGIVDYGIGNHGSIVQSLRDIGFRVRLGAATEVLRGVDILVLPGVGAFPAAMQALHERGLVSFLHDQAREQRPIIGICLGMQLLASVSHEQRHTAGLDLIPGEIVPLGAREWHIGWNTTECVAKDSLLQPSDGQAFYFNHSFCYQGPSEYQTCVTRHHKSFAAVIRRGHLVGLQFHPEKSQAPGRELLKRLISGLMDA